MSLFYWLIIAFSLQIVVFCFQCNSFKILGSNVIQNRLYKLQNRININPSMALFFKGSATAPKDGSDEDIFGSNADKLQPMDSTNLSPLPIKNEVLVKVVQGLIPITASLGFALTPSPKLYARVIGASIGGIAGFLAKYQIEKKYLSQLGNNNGGINNNLNDNFGGSDYNILESPYVANALNEMLAQENLLSLTLKDLEAIARNNNVPAKELSVLFSYLVAEVTFATTKGDNLDLASLKETLDFFQRIEFSKSELGDGLTIAANRLGYSIPKDEVGFYSNDFTPEQAFQAAKIYFLGDKLLSSFTGFYGHRFLFSLSYFLPDMFEELITTSSLDLFKRNLKVALSKPELIPKQEFKALKDFLRPKNPIVSKLTDSEMTKILREEIKNSISTSLNQASQLELSPSEKDLEVFERIYKALPILAPPIEPLLEVYQNASLPIYKSIIDELIKKIANQPELADKYRNTLTHKKECLHLSNLMLYPLFNEAFKAYNKDFVNTIKNLEESQSESKDQPPIDKVIHPIIVNYLEMHSSFMKMSSGILSSGMTLPLAKLSLSRNSAEELFKYRLSDNKIKKELLSPEYDALYGLSSQDCKDLRDKLVIGKLISWVEQCISENNFSEGAKNAITNKMKTLNISTAIWNQQAVDLFYAQAKSVAENKALPSEEDMHKLNQTSSFIQLPSDIANQIRLEIFGPKYQKVLKDSMSITNVIPDEYFDSIEKLRNRFGISKSDSDKIFSLVFKERLTPMLKDVMNIWQSIYNTSSTEPPQTEKKDSSVFMREIVNMADIVVGNYIAPRLPKITPATIKKMIFDKVKPLHFTLEDVGSPDELIAVFRSFLFNSLHEKDINLRARYESIETLFADIIGLPRSYIKNIKEKLGFEVSKAFFYELFTKNGDFEMIDTQRYAFLQNQVSKLDPQNSQQSMRVAASQALSDYIVKAIPNQSEEELESENKDQADKPNFNPRQLRLKLISLGFDLRKDLKFPESLIHILFSVEAQHLIELGKENELPDLLESYEITEESGQILVQAICRKYLNGLAFFGLKAAKAYQEGEAVKIGREMLKFLPYLSSEDKLPLNDEIYKESDKMRFIEFLVTDLKNNLDKTTEQSKDHKITNIQDVEALNQQLIDSIVLQTLSSP